MYIQVVKILNFEAGVSQMTNDLTSEKESWTRKKDIWIKYFQTQERICCIFFLHRHLRSDPQDWNGVHCVRVIAAQFEFDPVGFLYDWAAVSLALLSFGFSPTLSWISVLPKSEYDSAFWFCKFKKSLKCDQINVSCCKCNLSVVVYTMVLALSLWMIKTPQCRTFTWCFYRQ